MHEHYFFKEILEQPERVKDVLKKEENNIERVALAIQEREPHKIYLLGCGDSYANSLAGKYAFEEVTKIPTESMEALEFARYCSHMSDSKTVVILYSARGRSKLVLEALDKAKERMALTISLVNDLESPAAGCAEYALNIHAGPWKAPRTKTFTTALAATYLLALKLADFMGMDQDTNLKGLLRELCKIPNLIQYSFAEWEETVKSTAEEFRDSTRLCFVGGGPNYATALYGMAKIKETNRMYSTAYELEEFAHIETVDYGENEPTIIMSPGGKSSDRALEIISIAQRSLKRKVLSIIGESLKRDIPWSNRVVLIPDIGEILTPLVYAVPVQILAYRLAIERGINPDSPPLRDFARKIAFV